MTQEQPVNTPVGYRLQNMELLNWGTFHGKIWKIEPEGNNSLLTGDVGSGKSTLVDALTCLIVPHHKITFNKAAGAENKERTLLSYIRGEFKNTKGEESDSRGKAVSLRYSDESNQTFSVIIANFNNVGYQSQVSLVQIFWIENDKVQKLLVISENYPLSIKEHFTRIIDVKVLKRRLRELPNTELFDDNFSKYSQRFRQLFGMNSEKAIDLFYQTVSMKSVSSLTVFVKEQMLEKTEIKSQIEDLRKRFDDLNKAYHAVQEVRKQRDTLLPLVEWCKNFTAIEEKIQEIESLNEAIPVYFATKKTALLEEEITLLERKLQQTEGHRTAAKENFEEKRKAESQTYQDIENNGGARLKEIDREKEAKEKIKNEKRKRHEDYIQLTSFCELENANTDRTFYKNNKIAEEKIEAITQQLEDSQAQRAKLTGLIENLEDNIRTEETELLSLKSRENQIPLDFLNIRKQLAISLSVEESEIPFVGEMLRVNEREKEWEGALERLLRGFGVSMLVPEKYYKPISEYINTKKMTDSRNKGIRFEYFKVPQNIRNDNFHRETERDSVVNKIDIKSNTPFEEWLENELQKRFNLHCVSMEDFVRHSDVITKEGQIKTGAQRHTKDDRRELWDKKNFVLGWSNKEKIAAIEKHLILLKAEKQSLDTQRKNLIGESQNYSTLITKFNQILAYKNWYDLNWQDEVKAIIDLDREKEELQNSSNILNTLQEKLFRIQTEMNEWDTKISSYGEEIGGFKTKISSHRENIRECAELTNKPKIYPPFLLQYIDAYLKDKNLTVRNSDKIRQELIEEKTSERKNLSRKQNDFRDKIIKQMQEYKNTFPSDSLDLSDEIEAKNEYLSKLDKIQKEGLPAHEARLKTMLNKNTIEDIVTFDSKLNTHEKSIKEKIAAINKHLKEIEYNKGTYIKIIADRNTDREIKTFKDDLKACFANISDTGDAYTEERFNDVQKILNRFGSNDNKDIDWTNKVTDVRNWFDFNATENYLEDDTEKEYYSGSSGKSGGQKEKLAYTIIASALAYQFGLAYNEPRSKSFRFAVIDEAFGKGSDASAEYGLELFKKLNLQLLIVTPLQKIHIIENYINSVHYVANTEGNHSEVQNLSVNEYKSEKHLHGQASKALLPNTEI